MFVRDLKYNLPIIFWHCIRTHNANFKVYIDGPYQVQDLVKDLEQFKSIKQKELALTRKMNEIIEDWVKKDPSQWFWVHRRWNKELYR